MVIAPEIDRPTHNAFMNRWLTLVTAVAVGCLMALLSGCQGGGDEKEFLRAIERRLDLARPESGFDARWWQENQDSVLSEARASCAWLEGLPELDESQYPQGPELRRKYLLESDAIAAFSDDRRFSNIVIEYAWADLCIESRNSRTSLPWGATHD